MFARLLQFPWLDCLLILDGTLVSTSAFHVLNVLLVCLSFHWLQRWYGNLGSSSSPGSTSASYQGYRATATLDVFAAAAGGGGAGGGGGVTSDAPGVGWLRCWSAETPEVYLLAVRLVGPGGEEMQGEVLQVRGRGGGG